MFLRLCRLPGARFSSFEETLVSGRPQAQKFEGGKVLPWHFLFLDFLFASWAGRATCNSLAQTKKRGRARLRLNIAVARRMTTCVLPQALKAEPAVLDFGEVCRGQAKLGASPGLSAERVANGGV